MVGDAPLPDAAPFVKVGTAKHRILLFLKARSEYSWTPDQIADGSAMNARTVRVELRRLLKREPPLIANPIRGYYQDPAGLIRRGRTIDPRVRFHGIKLEARCNFGMGWPYRRLADLVTVRFPQPWAHPPHGRNRSWTTTSSWEGREVKITAHNDATVLLEVFLQASTYPLSLPELFGFAEWTCGAFGIPPEVFVLRQLGINVDELGKLAEVGLEGLTVQEGREMVLRYYEKAVDWVRTDVHDNRPLTADRLMDNAKAIFSAIEAVREVRP